MSFIKIFLKVLFSFIGILLLLLIINYIRLNLFYLIHKKEYSEAATIPVNQAKYVPQGLCYSEKYNVMLQTSYNSNHDISKLYVLDFSTGNIIKELKLKTMDGSDNINHVGGIATDDFTVWITSDYETNEFTLDEIINTKNDYIKSTKDIKIPIRGDFCYYKNNTLWIGDFFLNPFYKVPNNNPLLMGYDSSKEINFSKPDLIISLPKMVQGMAITENNEFVFTGSFTYLINSNLSFYKNVVGNEHEYYELNGEKIPYYHFNKSNLIKNIKLPPMAEGLFEKDNSLYILFESNSDTYKYAFPKLKKIIKYDL